MISRPRLSIVHRTLLALLALVSISLSAAASAVAADERTGRLLVLVDEGAQDVAAAQLERVDVHRAGEQVAQIGLVTVKPDAGQSLAATAETLRTLAGVKSVSIERRHAFRLIPNDDALVAPETAPGTPAGTPQQWWIERESLFAAWDLTRGSGAKVAIIDSGYDGNHPELSGKVTATLDNETAQLDTGPANVDLNGHGTHVSSMACGAANNGVGIVGAGLDCELIIAKSDLTDGSIARSIVQSTDLGADAISMSFGSDGAEAATPTIVAAIDYALERNIVLVAAAANNPVVEQGDPANVLQPTGTGPDINVNRGLTVTSAEFGGARSEFAGRGTQISIAAYGNFAAGPDNGPAGILGAFPANVTSLETGGPPSDLERDATSCGCRTSLGGDNRYAYLAGTSIATPQVAAIAALVAHFNPDLTAAKVVKILKMTATRPLGGWSEQLGWGIVNAGQALAAARMTDRTRPTSRARGPRGVRRSTRLTLRWTGRDRRRHAGLVASGVARYEVWRSTDGGRYRRIATTTRKRKRLMLSHGRRYRFYTIAVDRYGNRERDPGRADVSFRTRRASPSAPSSRVPPARPRSPR